MSGRRPPSPEEDLADIARLAGIELTPEFAPAILARLTALRAGVLAFGATIDHDTAPAIRFIAD
ncbi:MAG: hypothetical protein ACREFO_14610 [Acetobacteraceae bacterium]